MKKILLYTISCVLLLTSCDSFLDVKPTNQVDINATVVVATERDAQVIMNGLMRKMIESVYYGRNMFLYADAKGGDLCIGGRGRGYDNLYMFSHSPQSGSYGDFWYQIYHCLAQANNLIKSIDALTEAGNGSTALDYLKAQALTARALFYYDLVRLYGKPYDMDKNSFGVPLVLEVLGFDAQPTRATVEAIYTQITKDLTDAAPLFGTNKGKSNGYINYYACKAIQARVYLQMENYTAALAAAEDVIDNGGYTLYSNAEWVSSWSKQFQSESIFELAMLPTENNLGTSSLGSMMARTRASSANPQYTGWNYFIASDDFLTRLGEDPHDVRWGDSIAVATKLPITDTDAPLKDTVIIARSIMWRDEKSTPANRTRGELRKGCCYKYLGGISNIVPNYTRNANTGVITNLSSYDVVVKGDGKPTATAVNIKLIRLSEIYLIAAEAALLKSPRDKTKAADYLQAIRKRSPNLTPADGTEDWEDLFQMIKDERSKELLMEGHRFFDMMRWGDTIKYTSDYLQGSAPIPTRPTEITRAYYKAILPIHQTEINANPALASQQNPEY